MPQLTHKRKIAVVNQPFDPLIPPYQNSIGLWTYNVAPHLARQHSVTVFGRRSPLQREWNGQPGVNYIFIPPLIPGRVYDRFQSFYGRVFGAKLPMYASRLYYLDYITQIAWTVRREKFDIVHIHNFTQFVPFVRSANPKAIIALHMNCEWLTQLDHETMLQRMDQADLVFGSSDYITKLNQQGFPEHVARCRTIYNGVNTDMFVNGQENDYGTSKEQRLLFVGRVSPEKGVHDLISAFLVVAEKLPDIHLDIVGPISAMPLDYLVGVSQDPFVASLSRYYNGDYGTYLRQMVPPEMTGRVHFHGGLPQKDIVPFYQRADVLINPSYSESFGMSLVEALSCEVPVIATRVGGMVNIVDEGKTGFFVERGDIEQLSGTILSLVKNDHLRKQMGEKGREQVMQRFSWYKVAQNVLDAYDAVSENERL